MGVEHEYFRCVPWAYIAALDVHHARVCGRCETTERNAPLDRLVEHAMTRPLYNDARCVFWIVDKDPRSRPRQLVESGRDLFLYRATKVLSPNDFPSLNALAERLLGFQYYWESTAKPFGWKFTRQDLAKLLANLRNQAPV
jgi:hypothetical protein